MCKLTNFFEKKKNRLHLHRQIHSLKFKPGLFELKTRMTNGSKIHIQWLYLSVKDVLNLPPTILPRPLR